MDHITRRWRFWITILLLFFVLVFILGIYFLVPVSAFEIRSVVMPSSVAAVEGKEIVVNSARDVETPFPVATFEGDEITVNPVRYVGYLFNPGMGWQSNNSDQVKYFPESVVYADRDMITWKILNPMEDEYDWTPISEGIAQATAAGKQFSFRVFTISGGSYGGHQIPDWVLQKGVVILPNGEPDYSNCAYQQEWGKFVTVLLARYDGNPSIAFIDISGYGNFNEWGWQDQTEWDPIWDEGYKKGIASSLTLQTLDGQARRRLADMFIGGSFSSHQCRDVSGNILLTNYTYMGAQKTQLVMPYAGIPQSTQYVFSKRKDVGFRFDCLGRQDDLPDELSQIWRNAPVVYELCSSDEFDADVARVVIQTTHPILIHNNDYDQNLDVLSQLITPVGYRFFLKEIKFKPIVRVNSKLMLDMIWQNLGTSIPYEKMGQRLSLHIYLVDQFANPVLEGVSDVDPALWLPSDGYLSAAPSDYQAKVSFFIPKAFSAGEYTLEIALLDEKTGAPVQLAMEGLNSAGRYSLSRIQIIP